MPALRFDMTYPQREGFTRQLIKGIDIWAYTLPLAPGEDTYKAPMARRADNNHINATRLLQLSALNPSQRARELNVRPHIVIRGGLNNIQGTWVPLERAIELARKYKIDHLVAPILFDPEKPPTEFVDERHKGTTADSLPVGAVFKNGAGPSSAGASGSGQSGRHSAPGRATGATSSGPSVAQIAAAGAAAAAAKLGRSSMGNLLASSSGSSSSSGGGGGGGGGTAAGSGTDSRLGKRKFGTDDAAAAAASGTSGSSSSPALFPDNRHQHVEIASWTSRSHGSDVSAPPSSWLSSAQTSGSGSGSGSGAGASGSGGPGAGASNTAEGSSSSMSIAKSAGSSADHKQGLDSAERLRPRSPTLSELRSMLQTNTNKRRATSPGLRSAAVTNAARSSVRAGLDGLTPREASMMGLNASAGNGGAAGGPLSLAGSSGSGAGDGHGGPPFSIGLDPALANGSSHGVSVNDPQTWDSKFVAVFGRTRGWHEQRVLSRLRDGDIDGPLLLSLDFNDRSVFMLNQCGITVPGDQIRIIQAASFLREIYPTGVESRT
ncbi:Transcription factor mbp1 [Tilletia horrida]|nr:Transcription factor mbp1 [Tilletia horrida]